MRSENGEGQWLENRERNYTGLGELVCQYGHARDDRDRTYAEPGLGRLASSVAISGRFLSSFPDRTSEPGPNR